MHRLFLPPLIALPLFIALSCASSNAGEKPTPTKGSDVTGSIDDAARPVPAQFAQWRFTRRQALPVPNDRKRKHSVHRGAPTPEELEQIRKIQSWQNEIRLKIKSAAGFGELEKRMLKMHHSKKRVQCLFYVDGQGNVLPGMKTKVILGDYRKMDNLVNAHIVGLSPFPPIPNSELEKYPLEVNFFIEGDYVEVTCSQPYVRF